MSHLLIKDRNTLRNLKQPNELQAREMCEGFSNYLAALYPGYDWQVGMNQTMVYVQCLNMPGRWGFTIHLADIDVEGKMLMRAGGELLERFGCRRGKAKRSEIETIKKNIRGDAIPVN